MKKSILIMLGLGATLAAGAEHDKVIAPFSADEDGAMARLVNTDTGVTIDSTLVADHHAVFQGDIDEPVLAAVQVEGAPAPHFILEGGTISFGGQGRQQYAFGSILNDQMRALNTDLQRLSAMYQTAQTAQEQADIEARFYAKVDSAIAANDDNVLGYSLFVSQASGMDYDALTEAFARYPYFAKFARSQKIMAAAEHRKATQVGGKMIDFEIPQPDGTVARLSDYVGKGKYTLVDFWASWCGPCIRQTAVLKDIYNKYKDDGRLDVVGVAVWDEVEDTKRAIAQHDLPWPSILGAGTIPTDLYGIQGIPCIILFGPDGTILSRDKQSDELKADVDAALAR